MVWQMCSIVHIRYKMKTRCAHGIYWRSDPPSITKVQFFGNVAYSAFIQVPDNVRLVGLIKSEESNKDAGSSTQFILE